MSKEFPIYQIQYCTMVSSCEYAVVAARTPGHALDLLDSYLRGNPRVHQSSRDAIADTVHVWDQKDSGAMATLEGVLFPTSFLPKEKIFLPKPSKTEVSDA